MWQNERALVALSRRECLALLRTEQVGRAVFTDRALPQILPVTYARARRGRRARHHQRLPARAWPRTAGCSPSRSTTTTRSPAPGGASS